MAVSATEDTQQVKELAAPLFEGRGWMKFLGVVLILQGVVLAISVVGIVVAWLPIWAGVVLYQAAAGLEGAEFTGEKPRLLRAFGKLKLFFILNGITVLVLLVFSLFMGVIGGLMQGAMM